MSPTTPRSTKTIRLAGVAALLATTSILAACGSSSSSTGNSAKGNSSKGSSATEAAWSKYSFVIGDNGGDGSRLLAQYSGAFKTAPYKVSFANFTYGPPLVTAVASGAITTGGVGDVPPITGAATEYGFKIVAVERSLYPTEPDENIIVPKGSPIHTLAQLKGKTIAVAQGSSANGLVLLALKSVGLTLSDVKVDYLDPAPAATAFDSGKVDAWAIWNPQCAIAVKEGARVIAKGLPPIDQTSDYYVASDKVLDNSTEKAAFTNLLERLAGEFAWGVKHPAEYAKALATEDGITIADAAAALHATEFRVTPVEPSDVTAEQALETAFYDAGQIKKKVDVASIVENVLPAGYDSLTAVSPG